MTILAVSDYKEVNKGALKARFTLYFPALKMMIRDCTHMQSGGKEWVGFPSRQYEQDGQRKYFSYIMFAKDARDGFQHAALEAIKKAVPQQAQPSAFEEPPKDEFASFNGLQAGNVPF